MGPGETGVRAALRRSKSASARTFALLINTRRAAAPQKLPKPRESIPEWSLATRCKRGSEVVIVDDSATSVARSRTFATNLSLVAQKDYSDENLHRPLYLRRTSTREEHSGQVAKPEYPRHSFLLAQSHARQFRIAQI